MFGFQKSKKSKETDIVSIIKDISTHYIPRFMFNNYQTKISNVLKHFPRKLIKESISSYKECISSDNRMITNNNGLIDIYEKLVVKMNTPDDDNVDMANVKCVCHILLTEKIQRCKADIKKSKKSIETLKIGLRGKRFFLLVSSKVGYSIYLLNLIAKKYNVDVNDLNPFDRISFDIIGRTDKSLIRNLKLYIMKLEDLLKG